MGIEIIHNQDNLFIRKVIIHQILQQLGKVLPRSPARDCHLPPTFKRRAHHNTDWRYRCAHSQSRRSPLAPFLGTLATINEILKLRPFVSCQCNRVKLSATSHHAKISSYLSPRSEIEITAVIANDGTDYILLVVCCFEVYATTKQNSITNDPAVFSELDTSNPQFDIFGILA